MSPLSLLFIIFCSTQIVFIFLVNSDLRDYQSLFGESPTPANINDLLIPISLLCLLISAFRNAINAGPRIAGVFLTLILVYIIAILFQNIKGNLALAFFGHEFNSALASILVMICLRSCLASPWSSTDRSCSFFQSFEKSVVIVGAFGVVTLATITLLKIFAQPLDTHQKYPYKVTQDFLVMLLVSEDPIFAYHQGVDFKRLRDAVRELIESGQYGKGGSTISMQLAKVKYLSREKTILRKLLQITTACWLETIYDKETLLWNYINEIPYGPDMIGLSVASKHFYGAAPSELSKEQSLQLVLSVYNPLEYNPSVKPLATIVRNRGFVIRSRSRRNYNRFLTQIGNFEFALN